MEHAWLKPEALQKIRDDLELYYTQLVQLENDYQQNVQLDPLYRYLEVLRTDARNLYSIIQTRVYVGKNVSSNPNPLESDDFFAKEEALKNALYPAIHQFKADFTVVKESLVNPQLAEIKKKNLELEQRLERTTHNNDKTITQLVEDNASLFRQLNTALNDKEIAEKQMHHAEENRASMQGVFVTNENRAENLRSQVQTLSSKNEQLKTENEILAGRITDLTQRLDRVPSSNNCSLAGRGRSAGSEHTNTIAGSSGSFVPLEQAIANLYAPTDTPSTPSRQLTQPSSASRTPSIPARGNATSTLSAPARPRPRNTHTAAQTRVIRRVEQLSDDQIERLDPVFEDVMTMAPGEGYHWVTGHWRRNPGTLVINSNEEVTKKFHN